MTSLFVDKVMAKKFWGIAQKTKYSVMLTGHDIISFRKGYIFAFF